MTGSADPSPAPPSRADRLLNVATVLALVITAALAGMSFWRLGTSSRTPVRVAAEAPQRISGADSIFGRGLPLHAASSARDTLHVTVFSDFQCPYCADLAGYLRRRAPSLEHATIRFRHLPLTNLHPHAFDAALAATCAADQGRFAALHDSMFSRQTELGVTSWTSLARDAGIPDTGRFAACVQSREHADLVERDRQLATALRITGTPATLVGDRLVRGFPGEVYMDSVLGVSRPPTVSASRE